MVTMYPNKKNKTQIGGVIQQTSPSGNISAAAIQPRTASDSANLNRTYANETVTKPALQPRQPTTVTSETYPTSYSEALAYARKMANNQNASTAPTAPAPATATTKHWDQQKNDINNWLAENQSKYDPTAFNYLKDQWQNQGVDPRQFIQNYQVYQGDGLTGWLGKDDEFTGQDYIFDPNTNKWVSRSRGGGFDQQGFDFANPTQAQNRIDVIQRKISDIDADNKRLKENPFWDWGEAANTVKANEDRVKELRKEYDKINNIMPQLQLDPSVSNMLDSYYDYLTNNELNNQQGENRDPLTEEAYKQWEDMLMPLLEESLTNEYAPEVMKLLKEQLDPSFQKGRERIIADTARKGRIGGGLEASNLADLSNTFTQELLKEGGNYADQTADAVINRETQGYQEKIRNYLDSLSGVYGDQIGDINRVFQGSESDINRQVQEWAQGEGINLEDELTNLGAGTEDYINSLNDIGNLLETGGYLGTRLFDNTNTSDQEPQVAAAAVNPNQPRWWNTDLWKKHYSS